MPSTNKLSSHRLRSNSWHHVSGSLAKFLLSFCGIASFGVFTILVALAATFSVSILSNNSVSALSTVSNQVSVTIPGSIALRLLDSTATAEIDSLSFDLTPTASGTALTKRTIVDVATSNPTGYKLYMQSNYQKDGNYTTNLVHQDASVTDSIPTSTSASTLYWNYHNPLTSTTNPIPAHGTPDKIGQYFSPTNSNQTPLDVNVSVDTSIVAGTYENQLLFSAVGNPTSVNYTITFNMAGGEPQIPKIEERSAAGVYTTTLPSTVPTKAGFQFRNWLNTADGKTYNPGGTIQIYSDEEFTGDVTLTAQYDSTYTYTLTYNCNGGTGCPTNTSFGPTIDTSHSFTIPSATITKTGYIFTGFKGSDGNNYNLGDTVTIPSTAPNFTLTAQYSVNQYTLTVNPNGGTWSGSTSSQTFTQDYNTTKPIANPSANATYSITYNDNGQGATYTGTPTSVNRSFTGWDKAGSGEWNSNTKTYTYGAGDGSLTAQYNNTSDSFVLPTISKTGHNCYWASDPTGTKYGDGGESKTISSNTTIFAYCTVNQYTLTIKPNGGKWNNKTTDSAIKQNYNTKYPASGALPDATDGPTYSISYDMGSTGIAIKDTWIKSISRPFTNWTKGGTGTWDATNKVWTYGAGDGTLTANWNNTSNSFSLEDISNAKTGYTCAWHQGSASGAVVKDNITITGNTTFYAVCTINQYTLTIKPNGGKWNNKTTDSAIKGNYNSKYPTSGTLPDATDGPTYSISYNANSQGATCSGISSTSCDGTATVARPFTSWTKGGTGTWDATNKVWTYGAGDGTLTVNWNNTSNTFTLPSISKTGHTCYWASNTTGTKFGNGGESKTITANTPLYAYCTVNQYKLTVNPNGGTWSGSTASQSFTQNYNTTKTISNPTATPTYNISFDMSTSSMPAPANTVVARPFTSWSLSGAGSFAGGTYTYGAGNGTLTAQYSTTSNTFTLPSINNGFAGTCKWAEGSPTGTQYNIGASRTVTGDTTYYAVCTMQAMTTSICSNAAIDTMATLTDVRDNNTYSVRKLKDSKCWMTQNLRIVGPRTLTSADSNVTTNYTLPAINSGTWCTNFSDPTCTDQSNIDYKGDTTFGAYYNWFAATAGTGKHETSTLTTASVCPKGWRLPTGKRYSSISEGEFGDLYSYYNSDELMQGEPAFVLAGVRYGSDLKNVNRAGSYQSASGQSYLNRQGFLNIGVLDPGVTYKPEGFSVRCLAQ